MRIHFNSMTNTVFGTQFSYIFHSSIFPSVQAIVNLEGTGDEYSNGHGYSHDGMVYGYMDGCCCWCGRFAIMKTSFQRHLQRRNRKWQRRMKRQTISNVYALISHFLRMALISVSSSSSIETTKKKVPRWRRWWWWWWCWCWWGNCRLTKPYRLL